MTRWIEVRAEFDVAPQDWSLYVDAFDRFGCPGSLQTDQPPSLSGYLVDVAGTPARVEELSAELKRLGAESISTKVVEDEDWAESWKKFFKPRRIGKRFVVRPTWEPFDSSPGDLVITLDPGQAFGTGDHPTTRLCIELMESAELEGKSVLDLGCGSGILAIGAALLGAAQVLGSDIDPLAVEVAKQNVALNGVSAEFVVGDGIPPSSFSRQRLGNRPQDRSENEEGGRGGGESRAAFDAVISNIISATLIRLAPHVASVLTPGGVWIVSGIIEANWVDVLSAASKAGFSLVEDRREDGWVAASFRRD